MGRSTAGIHRPIDDLGRAEADLLRSSELSTAENRIRCGGSRSVDDCG
jgi:hypothetical protein